LGTGTGPRSIADLAHESAPWTRGDTTTSPLTWTSRRQCAMTHIWPCVSLTGLASGISSPCACCLICSSIYDESSASVSVIRIVPGLGLLYLFCMLSAASLETGTVLWGRQRCRAGQAARAGHCHQPQHATALVHRSRRFMDFLPLNSPVSQLKLFPNTNRFPMIAAKFPPNPSQTRTLKGRAVWETASPGVCTVSVVTISVM
jgi:hypothetical protein